MEPAEIRSARIKALAARMGDKATPFAAWQQDAKEAIGYLDESSISWDDRLEVAAILGDSAIKMLQSPEPEKTDAAMPAPVESPAKAESIGDPEE